MIKNYNAVATVAATSLTNSYFPKKPEKKGRMVRPWSDDVHCRFEIQTVCCGHGFAFFSCKNYELWSY